MTAPLLEIGDLRVDFRQAGRVVRAVDGLSYQAEKARTLALIGESGSGKTVSARAIMGLLPETAHVSGSIRYEGQELVGLPERRMRTLRGSQIAMVFQDPARSLNPTLRVGEQITEAIHVHRKATKAEAQDRAVELMELVRLPAARGAHPLQGGRPVPLRRAHPRRGRQPHPPAAGGRPRGRRDRRGRRPRRHPGAARRPRRHLLHPGVRPVPLLLHRAPEPV
jgi:ABC-type glutathione transport system ATPase component